MRIDLKASLITASIIGVAGIIFYGCFGSGTSGGIPIIHSRQEYQQVLHDGLQLSLDPLIKARTGQELTQEDRTSLRKAATDLEGCVEYRPTAYAASVQLGTIYRVLEEDDKALRSLRLGIDRGDGTKEAKQLAAVAHCNIGMVLAHQHKYKEAVGEYNQALKWSAVDLEALYGRACAYNELRQKADAIADLRLALRMNPGEPRCLSLLQLLAADLENTADAPAPPKTKQARDR